MAIRSVEAGTLSPTGSLRSPGVGNSIVERNSAFTVSASGGTETTITGYRVHTFTGNGTLTVNVGGTVEYLMVAGGGSGMGGGPATINSFPVQITGAGGGAGGVLQGSMFLAAGTYPIVVGAGGAAPVAPAPNVVGLGNSGNPTTFNNLTATGGGRGGGFVQNQPTPLTSATDGAPGGSGGGGAGSGSPGGGSAPFGGGSGTSGQGYSGSIGGPASYPGLVSPSAGGGGGGAYFAGIAGTSTYVGPGFSIIPATGGSGIESLISGSPVFYAGGGGGGPAGNKVLNGTGTNTGGGGGGSSSSTGTAGFPGIVIVRYRA